MGEENDLWVVFEGGELQAGGLWVLSWGVGGEERGRGLLGGGQGDQGQGEDVEEG